MMINNNRKNDIAMLKKTDMMLNKKGTMIREVEKQKKSEKKKTHRKRETSYKDSVESSKRVENKKRTVKSPKGNLG